MAKLVYKSYTVTTPKVEYANDFRLQELEKGKCVLFLKPEIGEKKTSAKNSAKSPVVVFRKNENLAEVFEYENKNNLLTP